MPRKVLITAGGTLEKIDDVRSIQNTGSGRLGSLIADAFVEKGYEVHYLCSEHAQRPKEKVFIDTIDGVIDLEKRMSILLDEYEFDAVIHSMAVSDFFVDNVYLESSVYERTWNPIEEAKITSDEGVFIHLKPAPKVIRLIKEKQASTLLIGFKLLSGASDEKLQEAAFKQMESVQSDYVLANHAERIQGDHHEAILLNREKEIIAKYHTKQAIAQGIVTLIEERVEK